MVASGIGYGGNRRSDMGNYNSTITLYSGGQFDYEDVRHSNIDIRDIAHGLSMICRFAGQCNKFYSVAQHSIHVAENATKNKMWGLLHDASEAYVVDLPGPIKHLPYMKEYRRLEHKVQDAICDEFWLSSNEPLEIQKIDKSIVKSEAYMLGLYDHTWGPIDPSIKIEIPWSSEYSEKRFLDMYDSL